LDTRGLNTYGYVGVINCLNVNEFVSIEQARRKIEARRVGYNEHRPHGSLGHLTPREYAKSGQKRNPEAAAF
jgi:putative transposase